MEILITGGGGFLGQKVAKSLAEAGELNGAAITGMTLADVMEPQSIDAPFEVLCQKADITNKDAVSAMFARKPDVIFHLAAIVSGQAELEFDFGLQVNLMGTWNILAEARCQAEATDKLPIVVYSSSVAVHGGEEPQVITDGLELNPQTSYGAQKAMGELLINDFTRKGFLDGRGLRLPTVSIRPGKANAAASSFMSSIFRDTMQGNASNCPSSRDYPIWYTAPRTVTYNIIHAATVPAADWGYNRCINLPGRSDTVGDMVAAMTRVFGPEAENRITWEPDPAIETIIMGWRGVFEVEKGDRLGFKRDASFEDNVRWFLEDDIVR